MKNLFRIICRILSFKKLRYRFIFYFLMASLIPTIVIGVTANTISKRLVLEKEIKEVFNEMEKLGEEINQIQNEKETIAIKFYINEFVQDIFQGKGNKIENRFEVMKLLYSNEYMNGNHSIILTNGRDQVYSNIIGDMAIDSNKVNAYMEQIKGRNQDYMWVGVDKVNDEWVMPYVRTIKSLDKSKELGIVVINLQEYVLYTLYKPLIDNFHRDVFILDDRNNIISNKNRKLIGSNFTGLLKVSNKDIEESSLFENTINGVNYQIAIQNDKKTNWKLVCLTPYESILSGTKSISLITFLICLMCIVISFVISIGTSTVITKPIYSLIKHMKLVQEGNLTKEFVTRNEDEIGMLGNYFNDMIRRLKKSIDEIYLIQKAKREAEFKALVFQINPHFLYNTLASIIWLAHANKKEQVIEMVNALSKLFRISISKGEEIIKIGDELEHVQSYVTIQQIRYKGSFKFFIDLDEDLFNLYTPKLILQPLVENSIYHGIKTIDKEGTIKIKGRLCPEGVVINVADSANNMTNDDLENIHRFLNEKGTQKDFGIGIKNVNDRIRLLFGEKYGLSYERKDGFLIAKVKLPIIDETGLKSLR